MVPFPKSRRDIGPWLIGLGKKGKRLATRNRNATIACSAAALLLGIGVTAWAVTDREPVKLVPYSAKVTGGKPSLKPVSKTSAVPKPAAPAQDPLAAARALYDKKQYDAAIDALQPLVGEHVEARFWLGKAHLAAGHEFRGCRQLSKYVELAPKGRYVTSAKRDLKKC